MTVQGNNIYQGYFVSDGNPRSIEFAGPVSYYYQMNWTQWNSTATPGVLKRAWYHSSMPNNSYLGVKNTDGAATDESIRGLTGGFTPIDPRSEIIFAATAVTAVTQANPAQITSNNHGLIAGDLVKLTNITGMQQISNYIWRVRSIVDPNNFTIFLDSTGFAAPGTGGTATKVHEASFTSFFPDGDLISGITQAANAVITLAYTDITRISIGAKYRIHIPAVYGMIEIDNLLGEIIAVDLVNNTVTVNINSTGFTAFAFPASGIVPFTPAQFSPVGENNAILTAATEHTFFFGLDLSTAVVGATDDHIKWIASTRELINIYH